MEFLTKKRPLIMGILNTTPDSFSDGGQYQADDAALIQVTKMIEEGADIIDVGGESTRPNANPVSIKEELNRVIPVIKKIRNICTENNVKISIDTRNSETMEIAIASGADIINDITALTHDKKSLEVAARARVPVCLMHMKGNPQNMQDNPEYKDIVKEVYGYLKSRIDECEVAGIDKSLIIADVGIGFGKTLEQNLELLSNLNEFNDLGVPILLGASRKSFISMLCDNGIDSNKRLAGSLAAIATGMNFNISIFRVHDVYETKQFIDVYHKII